jgi:hypothetical protein
MAAEIRMTTLAKRAKGSSMNIPSNAVRSPVAAVAI